MTPEASGSSSMAFFPWVPPLVPSCLSYSAHHSKTSPTFHLPPSLLLPCLHYKPQAPTLIISPNFPFLLKLSPLSFPLNLPEWLPLKLSLLITLEVGDGQGGLACCSSWGRKELDMTEQLN